MKGNYGKAIRVGAVEIKQEAAARIGAVGSFTAVRGGSLWKST